MSQYEDDADRLAEHNPEECDDPFCQICVDEDDTDYEYDEDEDE